MVGTESIEALFATDNDCQRFFKIFRGVTLFVCRISVLFLVENVYIFCSAIQILKWKTFNCLWNYFVISKLKVTSKTVQQSYF